MKRYLFSVSDSKILIEQRLVLEKVSRDLDGIQLCVTELEARKAKKRIRYLLRRVKKEVKDFWNLIGIYEKEQRSGKKESYEKMYD